MLTENIILKNISHIVCCLSYRQIEFFTSLYYIYINIYVCMLASRIAIYLLITVPFGKATLITNTHFYTLDKNTNTHSIQFFSIFLFTQVPHVSPILFFLHKTLWTNMCKCLREKKAQTRKKTRRK